MSETPAKEETPIQRAARLRREKREAKIREGGASRLDRITGLSSGRVPPASPRASSPVITPVTPGSQDSAKGSATSSAAATPVPSASPVTPASQPLDPELVRQQEQIRALLRSQNDVSPSSQSALQGHSPAPHVTRASEASDDTELDILDKLLSGNANTPGAGIPGLGADSVLGKAAAIFADSGLPGFGQGKPVEAPDPAIEKSKRRWKSVHLLFGVVMAGYFLYMLQSSLTLYSMATAPVNADATDFDDFNTGSSTTVEKDLRIPPPASFQNPTAIFLLGELMLTALRGMLSGTFDWRSSATWSGLLSNVMRDAKIVVFGLGISSMWWNKEAAGDTPRLKADL